MPYSISTASLQGRPLSQAAPAGNDVLRWNGASWAPVTSDLAGDVTGPPTATQIAAGVVGSTEIANLSIQDEDIANVDAGKLFREANALRSRQNLRAVTGVEGDYDGKKIPSQFNEVWRGAEAPEARDSDGLKVHGKARSRCGQTIYRQNECGNGLAALPSGKSPMRLPVVPDRDEAAGDAPFGLLAWGCVDYGNSLRQRGEVSMTLQLPIFWVPYLLAVSCVLVVLIKIYHLGHPGKPMIKP